MGRQRIGVVVAGAALALGALASPAWAHVQVEADPGSPGASDATLKIMAAGESGTAGTNKLEVVADPAIPADQVTLVTCPSGWTLTPGAAGGFTLAGPALAKGDDANLSVKVKQLPNAPQVTFKVVQTYSDGEVVRWIELTGADGKEPDNPAPIVKLTGAKTIVLDMNDQRLEFCRSTMGVEHTVKLSDTGTNEIFATYPPNRSAPWL